MKTFVTDKHSNGSAVRYKAVAPSDDAVGNFENLARRLWIGTAGDVAVVDELGDVTLFKSVPSGYELRVICSRVNANGTTAANIVALF